MSRRRWSSNFSDLSQLVDRQCELGTFVKGFDWITPVSLRKKYYSFILLFTFLCWWDSHRCKVNENALDKSWIRAYRRKTRDDRRVLFRLLSSCARPILISPVYSSVSLFKLVLFGFPVYAFHVSSSAWTKRCNSLEICEHFHERPSDWEVGVSPSRHSARHFLSAYSTAYSMNSQL